MNGKSTDELNNILKSTHPEDASDFFEKEQNNLLESDRPFSSFMREIIKAKGLRQQDVFLMADIPERYGYKLLSEEKHTRQRDVILRICYAAKLTLEETQEALRIYGMPELYARKKRDSAIIIAFHNRPGSIIELNAFLKDQGLEPLRTSGTQE